MKLLLKAGTTSQLCRIFIQDSTSTTGAGLAGLTFSSSGLKWSYIREDQSTVTVVTAVTATLGTWTSAGFKEVDSTNFPGLYEIGLPNAVLTSGKTVQILLFGATNMVPCPMEIELVAVDLQSSTNFVASVPAVVGAVGSVTAGVNATQFNGHSIVLDTNNFPSVNIVDLNGSSITTSNSIDANVTQIDGQNVTAASPITVLASVGTASTSTAQTGDSFAIVNSGTFGNAKLVRSTTPANTLGVNSGGQAGIDWGNVGNPTTTVGLSGTTVNLNLTQAVPTSNTAQTVGDALNAARAQGFGKWVLSGTTLTLYAGDNITTVHTFTLDSATTPTQRS